MKLLIVESPAKAKTIEKYLGKDFKVIASYGHVRDLISKDGSVDPSNNFEMKWSIDERGQKQINAIEKTLKNVDEIFLATDPDREGEAISWHITDILKDQMQNISVKRVVFHEITKNAIKKAIESPRSLDQSLVDAYLARRALDYLVGFKLSPILWRKLPKSKSAGRVQSVALRLIFEREIEIEKFKSEEYWTLIANFKKSSNESKKHDDIIIQSKLIKYNGKKVDKLFVKTENEAIEIAKSLQNDTFKVLSLDKKTGQRKPFAPFITSTLQQEASRKLGFSARQTMSLAQKLYEGIEIDGEHIGLITYMRTDSVHLADEALTGIRAFINENYGEKYLPKSAVTYSNKVKNAQEAHEAIRPVHFSLSPDDLKGKISAELLKLYELIWKRTIASQMQNAKINQVTLDISNESEKSVFRTTGSTVSFDGFLKIYDESKDDQGKDADEIEKQILPELSENEQLFLVDIAKNQHFTKPPFRYSEASLVKKLEELGIGRPSTYASILSVLQQRSYVKLQQKKFFIEDLGRFVSSFLKSFFTKYVEYDFTAKLEQQLDDVSNGKNTWKSVLTEFWGEFYQNILEAEKLRITDVINHLEGDLDYYLFKSKDGSVDKKCPKCDGTLSLKLGKYGAFIACSNYPECKYTKKIALSDDENSSGEEIVDENGNPIQNDTIKNNFETKTLGIKDGLNVLLKKGPYGFYVQLGEGQKPKRSAIPKNIPLENVTLEIAISLLELPKILGNFEGIEVSTGIGRFGPYIKYGNIFVSVKDFDKFSNLNLEEAVDILQNSGKNLENAKKSTSQEEDTPKKNIKKSTKKAEKSAENQGNDKEKKSTKPRKSKKTSENK